MKSHFHMKELGTKTRFEKEAKGNSELAYLFTSLNQHTLLYALLKIFFYTVYLFKM